MKKKFLIVLSLLVVLVFVASCAPQKELTPQEQQTLDSELNQMSDEELDQVIEEAEKGGAGALAGQASRFKLPPRASKQQVVASAYKIKLKNLEEERVVKSSKVTQHSSTYAQVKCSNIDGDLDYDGVLDTNDQCPFSGFAMAIMDFGKGDPYDPYDVMLWQGASIMLTDLSISADGEALAHVTIENQATSDTKKASVGAKTPLALGGVISGLKGRLLLSDWRWESDSNGNVKSGYAAIMAISDVNLNTGCNPDGERSFP